MALNKKYGKLNNGVIEYAPNSFKTDTGIIINPPEEMYLVKGWYKVIDEKPVPESGCYVKFNGYEQDDEEKTITFQYVQIMIPVQKTVYTYSKLKLEMNIFKYDLQERFDDFIDNTMLSNEVGNTAPLRKFYDQANELKSDNQYFETYYELAKQKMEVEDWLARKILNDSIMES